jgi:hypothetical protein
MTFLCSTVGAVCVNGHISISSEYRTSKAVGIGTVMSEKTVPETPDGFFLDGTAYQVRVDEIFRGDLPATVNIFSENTSGRFPMNVGSKYLMFVYAAHGRLLIDYCGNSGLLSKSSQVLQQVEKLAQKKAN